MAVLLVASGLVTVLVAILDVVWTAAAAGAGAGPLTGRVSARLWRASLALGRRPTGPRHRFLTVAGIALAVVMVLMWATMAWVGWWMVFSASDGAVVDSASGQPAGLFERLQFAGASLFTLGSDEVSAGSGVWQFAAIGATATGVVFVTLAISYFVPVASALADGRQLGAYISSLGETPEQVLGRAWTEGGFKGLDQHLVALTPMVHALAERHLTYPVLQYFHSRRERTSTALSLVVLDEAVTLLRSGVAPDARLEPVTLEPLSRAIGWYLDTVQDTFVSGPSTPLPPADIDALRKLGIPTVDDDEFASALEDLRGRRCQLTALLIDDGWLPEAWERRVDAMRAGG
ncbi:MAG: two pore domain potassium channel family protein [Acidimicrobiales bacterium]